jgi:hypothetical protein
MYFQVEVRENGNNADLRPTVLVHVTLSCFSQVVIS